jgi:hypothetical protein
MRLSTPVQLKECMLDVGVYPCLMTVSGRLCAFIDHLRKGMVGGDVKPLLPDGLCQ